jgi:Flp pilus assembly protein TadB
VSRERARRREQRAVEAARRAAEARQRAQREAARRRRRERLRRAARSLLPYSPGQRYTRRTRTQRGTVAVVLLGVFVLVWMNTTTWGPRIAALLAAALITPALLTILMDRSSR